MICQIMIQRSWRSLKAFLALILFACLALVASPAKPALGAYQKNSEPAHWQIPHKPLTTLENFGAYRKIAPEFANPPNRTPQIVINRQNGAEFEQQVIDALGPVGGVKNTTPETVTLSNGTEVTTIPDLWGAKCGGGECLRPRMCKACHCLRS